MRDFKAGGDINIQGDLSIVDHSHFEHKLLIHCSSDELLQERPFRQENIKIEQRKKIKRLSPFYLMMVVFGLVAAGWGGLQRKNRLGDFCFWGLVRRCRISHAQGNC